MKNRLVEKLEVYKDKISHSTSFDDSFVRLIGIELYDFIQENTELKFEFDKRLNYLQNLAKDKDFENLQDNLFNVVQKVLKLTSLQEVQQKQDELKIKGQAWSNNFKTKKKLGDGTEDIWLTLPEIYVMAQDKKNYYRLGDEESKSFRLYGEIVVNVHTLPIKEQYEVNIDNLFKWVFFNKYINDKKGQEKLNELYSEYNKYYYKMDELMFRIPIKLHISNFERFLIDCAMFHPREGYEFFYSRSFSSTDRDEQRFKKVKENSYVVIDGLVEKLNEDVEFNEKNNQKPTIDFVPENFEISVKDREIWVNNYLISRPHAVGENLEFFEYVRSKPANTKIEWITIPDNAGYEMLKRAIKDRRFVKILNALGFKGEITKAFFYKVGPKCLQYRGDKITTQDLKTTGVKIPLFLKELELAHAKLVPNSPV